MVELNSTKHVYIEHEVLKTASVDLGNFETFGGSNHTALSQFDLFLFHISSSQVSNACYFPSNFALHMLMTLASRCPSINYTGNDKKNNGKLHWHELLLLDQNGIPSLADRAMTILTTYNQAIALDLKENVLLKSIDIYRNLRLVLLTFLNDEIKAKKTNLTVNFLKYSSQTNMDSENSEKAIPGEISDSEPENLLISRFPESKQSFDYKLNQLKHTIHEVSNEFIPQKKQKKDLSELFNVNDILIFSENLITFKLNPILNHNYSVLDLIQWTFSCGVRGNLYSSSIIERRFHDIYQTQMAFLNWLFDFLQLDFNTTRTEIIEQRKAHSPYNKKYGLAYPYKKKTLFFLLFLYLQNPDPNHGFFLKVVFHGLGSFDEGHYCYERERQLVWGHESCKSSSEYDIADSFKLRYKILFMMFEILLCFSHKSVLYINYDDFIDVHEISQDILSTNDPVLIRHINFSNLLFREFKLKDIDDSYFRLFINEAVQGIYQREFNAINLEFFFGLARAMFDSDSNLDLNLMLVDTFLLMCRKQATGKGNPKRIINRVFRYLVNDIQMELENWTDPRSYFYLSQILEVLITWFGFITGSYKVEKELDLSNSLRKIKRRFGTKQQNVKVNYISELAARYHGD